MSTHDERVRLAVDGLRATRGPSASETAALLARLERQLGGPPEGGPSGTESGPGAGGASTLGHAAKVVGATLGLTAGGLLLLRAGVLALQGIAGEGAPPAEREPVVVDRDTREQPPVVEPLPHPAPESQPAPESRPASQPVASPSAKQAARKPVPSQPSTDLLAAELALLQAAKATRDANARLELLEDHADQFPGGALASERDALIVVALCELDRVDEARTRAGKLAHARAGSPLLDRMREGCPALADQLSKDPK